MSADIANETRTGHMALCARSMAAVPGAEAAVRRAAGLGAAGLDAVLRSCARLDVEHPFTAERAEFVGSLVMRRRALLLDLLEGER